MGVSEQLVSLADDYRAAYGNSIADRDHVRSLVRQYSQRTSDSLLEGLSVAASVDSIYFADQFHMDRVTPQMEEAWKAQFPNIDMESRLSEIAELSADERAVVWPGFANAWKGKYFEVWVRDELNAGRDVGGLALDADQKAVLHPDPQNEGFDLIIRDSDGTELDLFQLKASRGITEAREALRKYPDYDIVSTDEAANIDLEDRIFGSGMSNEDLEASIAEPMESILDSSLEDIAEAVVPFLPVVVILSKEGIPLMMGRQSANVAIGNAVNKAMKSGAAFGAGTVAVALGAGLFSLPTAVLTRLGVDRVQVHRRLAARVAAHRAELATVG